MSNSNQNETGLKPRQIFVSYNRKDSKSTLRIVKDLKENGLKVWLDQINILPGTRWDDEIEKALSESTDLLVILSKAGVASQNLQDEVAYAIDRNKTIIPVMIEECEIPMRMLRFQFVDFTKSYETAFPKLMTALDIEKTQFIISKTSFINKNRKWFIGITTVLLALMISFFTGLFKEKSSKNNQNQTNDSTNVSNSATGNLKTDTLGTNEKAETLIKDYSKYVKINLKPYDPRFFTDDGFVSNWGGGSQALFITESNLAKTMKSIKSANAKYNVFETIVEPSMEIIVDAVYNPAGENFSCIVDDWGVILTKMDINPKGKYLFYGTGGADGFREKVECIIKPKEGQYPVTAWLVEAENDTEDVIRKKPSDKLQFFKPNEIISLSLAVKLREITNSTNETFTGTMQFYAKVNIDGNKYTIYSKEKILVHLSNKLTIENCVWSNSDTMETLRQYTYVSND